MPTIFPLQIDTSKKYELIDNLKDLVLQKIKPESFFLAHQVYKNYDYATYKQNANFYEKDIQGLAGKLMVYIVIFEREKSPSRQALLTLKSSCQNALDEAKIDFQKSPDGWWHTFKLWCNKVLEAINALLTFFGITSPCELYEVNTPAEIGLIKSNIETDLIDLLDEVEKKLKL